jgi:putative phosphoribosyl transferase
VKSWIVEGGGVVEEANGGTLVEAGSDTLEGDLWVPGGVRGVVLSAHGSNRMSPHNRLVAERLNAGGLATLLLNLLTAGEGG